MHGGVADCSQADVDYTERTASFPSGKVSRGEQSLRLAFLSFLFGMNHGGPDNLSAWAPGRHV